MNVAPVTNRTVVYPVPPVPPVQAVKRADTDDNGAKKTPEPASETATPRPPQSASARQGLGTLLDIRV